MHAQVHDIARSEPGYAGLLGWAGFDYASLNGGNRDLAEPEDARGDRHLPGAQARAPPSTARRSTPAVRPVILPVFFWDFGPARRQRARGRTR